MKRPFGDSMSVVWRPRSAGVSTKKDTSEEVAFYFIHWPPDEFIESGLNTVTPGVVVGFLVRSKGCFTSYIVHMRYTEEPLLYLDSEIAHRRLRSVFFLCTRSCLNSMPGVLRAAATQKQGPILRRSVGPSRAIAGGEFPRADLT